MWVHFDFIIKIYHLSFNSEYYNPILTLLFSLPNYKYPTVSRAYFFNI